jgi:YesN/AraC family two-component response regulator
MQEPRLWFLPVDASQRSEQPSQFSDSEDRPLQNKRVVIVEDEGITHLQLRKICLQEGMMVAGSATNGARAVQLVKETVPDLVLMDIQMPVMNGLDAAEKILSEMRMCIIMLTAYNDEEYRSRALMAGASGYVLKPVTSTTLIPEANEAYRRFLSRPV